MFNILSKPIKLSKVNSDIDIVAIIYNYEGDKNEKENVEEN